MEIFRLFGSILIDNDKANKSISKTKDEADSLHGKLSKGMKTAGKWGGIVLGAATVVGGAIVGIATKAANMADAIDENSAAMGLSKKAYQEWQYILNQNGVKITSMKSGMKALTTSMASLAEGGKKGEETLGKLGFTLDDLKNKSQEQIFEESIIALQKMPAGYEKARLAQQLFGKQGQELLPILNATKGTIGEMKAEAEKLGIVMSDDSVNAGAKFADTLQALKDTGSAAFAQIGLMFMPALQGFADWVILHMPEIKAFIKTAMTVIGDLFKAMGPTIDVLIGVFKIGFGIVRDVFKAFSALFKGDWSGLWDAVKGIIKGFFNIFKSVGKALFGKLWEGIKEKWNDLKDWVSEKVEWIQNQWNKVTGGVSNAHDNGGFQHASGLNYVPYDGYKASLHRGERIVSANENPFGGGGGGEVVTLLKAILDKTGNGAILFEDQIVGAMAPGMSTAIGRLTYE